MSIAESSRGLSVASAWDRYALAYQHRLRPPTDVVSYGPGVGTETDYRLLGPLSGKRVLDLGCGGGQNTIALAKQGAIAIGVDISVEQLGFARRLIEQEEMRIELKHGDLAELAFQRADSVDIAFSAFAFQYVPDIGRVVRQVHRVLKPQGSLVFSIPHPSASVIGATSTSPDQGQLLADEQPPTIRRSYFDRSPLEDKVDDLVFSEHHRTLSDIFMGLVRCGFRVEVLLEPDAPKISMLPVALIIRARKEA